MPFGAELGGEGTLFRLWAPGANEVDIVLDAHGMPDELAMSPVGSGIQIGRAHV